MYTRTYTSRILSRTLCQDIFTILNTNNNTTITTIIVIVEETLNNRSRFRIVNRNRGHRDYEVDNTSSYRTWKEGDLNG